MRKKIAAANWKMHKTPAEALEFFTQFKQLVPPPVGHCDVVFFVPALLFGAVADHVQPYAFGTQNIYFEKEGAFTGENSPYVAERMGATYTLVGHSERRQIFGESEELLAKKMTAASQFGMVPVLCVGETLSEREAGHTEKIIARQLQSALAAFPAPAKFIVAYEPVWAIGTGKVATPEQAEAAHAFLRQELGSLRGKEGATETPILYGGSVKPDNAKTLAAQPNIDGFLVGGASLKAQDFAEIVRALDLWK